MTLRQQILDYMAEKQAYSARMSVCTWWFKFHIDEKNTGLIRRELNRLEKEGVVKSDRSQSNNTQWWLTNSDQQRSN